MATLKEGNISKDPMTTFNIKTRAARTTRKTKESVEEEKDLEIDNPQPRKRDESKILKPVTPIDPIDDLQESTESLFDFLRYEVFQDIAEEEKKELFLNMFDVAIRSDTIFPKIMESISQEDGYTNLVNLITNPSSKIEFKGAPENMDLAKKAWALIVDCYFFERKPSRSFELLRYLLAFQIEEKNIEGLQTFVSMYKSADPSTRQRMIPKYICGSFNV